MKKIYFQLLFVALYFLFGLPGYGQDAFQPGYVLPVGADTLRGEVREAGPRRQQRECVFRSGPGAAVVSYTAAELRGYGFKSGGIFRRGRVAQTVADTATTLEFQEVLVRGTATLLYATDRNLNPQYYLRMEGGLAAPIELKEVQRRVENDGRIYNQLIKQFQQVLLSQLASCPALAPAIRRSRLSEEELTRVVQTYNACVAPTGTAAAAPVAATKFRATISLLAGVAFAQRLMVRNDAGFLQYNQTLTAPLTPTLGGQLTLRNARFSRHISLSFAALYQRRNYQNTQAVPSGSSNANRYETAFNADYVGLPFSLNLEFGHGALQPFLGGGFIIDYLLNQSANSYTTFYNNTGRPPTPAVMFDSPSGIKTGFLLSGGLTSRFGSGHEAAVQLRYEVRQGVDSYIYTSSGSTAFVALLSYGLSKK